MKAYDEIKKVLNSRKDKKEEKLTQKRQDLTRKIRALEIEIQGFREDEWAEAEKRNYGEPVDEFIEKNATKFRQRAEREWLKATGELYKTNSKLEKIQKRLQPEQNLENK